MAYVLGSVTQLGSGTGIVWTVSGTPTAPVRVVFAAVLSGGSPNQEYWLSISTSDGRSANHRLAQQPAFPTSGDSVNLGALLDVDGATIPALAGLTLTLTDAGDIFDEWYSEAWTFAVTSSTASATGLASLGAIRDTVRQRCDMVGSEFVTDDELDGWINASAHELYDLLVQKFSPGSYYVAPEHTFTADGTSDSYALPEDFYKLLGVDLQLAADSWTTVKPFAFAERNRYAYPNVQSATIPANTRYRIMGGNLLFTPRPTAGQVFRLWYVPKMTLLSVDTDTLDGVSGWEEYVVADVCIKALTKEESDPSVFMAQKQALLLRIESAAENRDAGSPATVADSQGADFVWTGNGVGGWR